VPVVRRVIEQVVVFIKANYTVGISFLPAIILVKDFKIINERMCCLRLKAKWFSCTLMNVHTPTNEKTEEIKEEFYSLLEQNITQIARSDTKIILGDFIAKVGEESIYKPTIGNESLHNETNNNAIQMIQFEISDGLNVRSTTFPHEDIHRETWYSADSRTANQIDHVLISNRFRSAITDISTKGTRHWIRSQLNEDKF